MEISRLWVVTCATLLYRYRKCREIGSLQFIYSKVAHLTPQSLDHCRDPISLHFIPRGHLVILLPWPLNCPMKFIIQREQNRDSPMKWRECWTVTVGMYETVGIDFPTVHTCQGNSDSPDYHGVLGTVTGESSVQLCYTGIESVGKSGPYSLYVPMKWTVPTPTSFYRDPISLDFRYLVVTGDSPNLSSP